MIVGVLTTMMPYLFMSFMLESVTLNLFTAFYFFGLLITVLIAFGVYYIFYMFYSVSFWVWVLILNFMLFWFFFGMFGVFILLVCFIIPVLIFLIQDNT